MFLRVERLCDWSNLGKIFFRKMGRTSQIVFLILIFDSNFRKNRHKIIVQNLMTIANHQAQHLCPSIAYHILVAQQAMTTKISYGRLH